MYDLRKERVFNLTKLINKRVTVAGKTTDKNCHEVLGLQVSKDGTKNSFSIISNYIFNYIDLTLTLLNFHKLGI